MVIDIKGYDRKKMQQIEDKLVDEFIQQDEIDDPELFVELKAPEEYKHYFHEYKQADEELRKRGIRV